MQSDDAIRSQIAALIDLEHSGQITAAQVAELEALVLSSPQARAYYVKCVNLSATLTSWANHPDVDVDPLWSDVDFDVVMAAVHEDAPMRQPERDRSRASVPPKPSPVYTPPASDLLPPRVIVIPTWLAYGVPALAAALALALIIGLPWGGNTRTGPTPTPTSPPLAAAPQPVASVLRVSDIDERSSLVPGARLVPGPYELTQGFIEVQMDRGATAIFRAPCRFELIDDNHIDLSIGQLTAEVPPEARLFTVYTPSMTLVDLGTRFGADVGEDGSATAAVFKGEVITKGNATDDAQESSDGQATASESILLKANDAIHASLDAGLDETPSPLKPDHDFLPTWDDLTGRVNISGQARFFVQPPPDIGPNALIDPDHMIIFREQTTLTDAPIRVMTELSNRVKRPTYTVLPSGKRVRSYMIHFSPSVFTPGNPQANQIPSKSVHATIEFPGRVIGLVNGGKDLANTNDSLGLDSVAYLAPSGSVYNNVIDSWPTDRFTITGEQQNILDIQLTAGVHSDQARVLVEVPTD